MEYFKNLISSIDSTIAILSLGITVVIVGIAYGLYLAFKSVKEKKNKWKSNVKNNPTLIKQNDAIDKYVDDVERRLARSKVKFNARIFVLILTIFALLSFMFTLQHFKNFAAAVLVGIVVFSLPDYVLFLLQDRINRKVEDQIVVGIRVFTSEFLKSRNIDKSLAEASLRVKDPIGEYFAEAYNDLLMGYSFETVVSRMSVKNDNEYWKMFAQLLFQLRGDSTVISLFTELVNRVERNIEANRHNDASLSGERILALLMSLLPIPAYFIMKNMVPETTYFMQETTVGRFVLVFTFVSTLLFIYVDKYSRKVE